MPLWEQYTVTATVSYEIKCGDKFVTLGAAPGEDRGTSNREVTGLTMTEAADKAIEQAKTRALASIRASETIRRRELGYPDGH